MATSFSVAAVLRAFVAGALATLVVHQPLVALLGTLGVTPWVPYDLTPTAPLGIPGVVSASLWAGAWGVVLLLVVLARVRWPRGEAARAATWGALLPTLFAALVVVPLEGRTDTTNGLVLLAAGLLVNAAWGVATWAIARLLAGSHAGAQAGLPGARDRGTLP